MHPLGQLIEDCKSVNGWTNGDVARQSGDRVGRGRVQQIINNPVKAMPGLEVIEGLSRGLRVPGWIVVDAALESMGYPHRPSRLGVEEAIATDPSLSEQDRAALRALLMGLRTIRGEEVTGGKPQPRRSASHQARPAPIKPAHREHQWDPGEPDMPDVVTPLWVKQKQEEGRPIAAFEVDEDDVERGEGELDGDRPDR